MYSLHARLTADPIAIVRAVRQADRQGKHRYSASATALRIVWFVLGWEDNASSGLVAVVIGKGYPGLIPELCGSCINFKINQAHREGVARPFTRALWILHKLRNQSSS